jgi:hypothetical protein
MLVGCENEEKSKISEVLIDRNLPSLQDIFSNLSDTAAVFEIDPTKDTIITCPKGTLLYLPANIFETTAGELPVENVNLKVSECYSNSDFAANGLSCISNGQLLETGGMVNINAVLNDESLKIRSGSEYALYFPKNGKSNNMELFYGQTLGDETVSWLPKSIDPNLPSGNPVEEPIDVKAQIKCPLHLTYITASISSEEVTWKFLNSNETVYDFFDRNFKPSDQMEEAFCDNNYKIESTIVLNETGSIKEVTIDSSSTSAFDRVFVDFLKSLPPFDLETMAPHSSPRKFSIGLVGQAELDRSKFKKLFKKKYASFKNKAIEKVDQSELNYFVLSASKLGWINCDRFLNSPEDKIELLVNSDNVNNLKAFVVFKGINSIMNGTSSNGKIIFNNIPIGQSIRVIGLNNQEGKPTMCVLETTVDDKEIQLSNFSEFSIDQLETELNRVN